LEKRATEIPIKGWKKKETLQRKIKANFQQGGGPTTEKFFFGSEC